MYYDSVVILFYLFAVLFVYVAMLFVPDQGPQWKQVVRLYCVFILDVQIDEHVTCDSTV